jgi:hypothetical protein
MKRILATVIMALPCVAFAATDFTGTTTAGSTSGSNSAATVGGNNAQLQNNFQAAKQLGTTGVKTSATAVAPANVTAFSQFNCAGTQSVAGTVWFVSVSGGGMKESAECNFRANGAHLVQLAIAMRAAGMTDIAAKLDNAAVNLACRADADMYAVLMAEGACRRIDYDAYGKQFTQSTSGGYYTAPDQNGGWKPVVAAAYVSRTQASNDDVTKLLYTGS